ncbi:methyltransferase [Dentipellis sp. KUC8613]|nr:methyltransferase [Dentipellis sp. KUC8613]
MSLSPNGASDSNDACVASSSTKRASSVHDVNAAKPPFGSRFLTEEDDVWSQNAWDHVPAPDDQADTIARALERQRLAPVPDEEKPKYNEKPAKHWDNFYKMNASNFFKNRKWLHVEFPDLVAALQPSAGPRTVVEIGCGAGNSVFPLLSENQNPGLNLHAYDYSSHAVKLVQHNPLYEQPPCGTITASVWDLTSASLPADLAPGSADIVVLVFVLSALHPSEWQRAVANIHTILKPGGLVLMRDYGRHDLTQLRFRSNRLLDENLYIRGDKTRVYFFDADDLARLFTGAAAPQNTVTTTTTETEEADAEPAGTTDALPPSTLHSPLSPPTPPPPPPPAQSADPPAPSASAPFPDAAGERPTALQHPLFEIVQLGVDRRLLVNRKRQLKMYRVWMQGQFRKL